MKINQEAIEQAKSLILSGKVDRTNTWGKLRASLMDKVDSMTESELKQYSNWFLGVDDIDQHSPLSPSYDFLYGDFEIVHRGALKEAKTRAQQLQLNTIEAVIDELFIQMDKEPDVVSEASDESFPASDPPNWRDRR